MTHPLLLRTSSPSFFRAATNPSRNSHPPWMTSSLHIGRVKGREGLETRTAYTKTNVSTKPPSSPQRVISTQHTNPTHFQTHFRTKSSIQFYPSTSYKKAHHIIHWHYTRPQHPSPCPFPSSTAKKTSSPHPPKTHNSPRQSNAPNPAIPMPRSEKCAETLEDK
jgi:hypothetical protein